MRTMIAAALLVACGSTAATAQSSGPEGVMCMASLERSARDDDGSLEALIVTLRRSLTRCQPGNIIAFYVTYLRSDDDTRHAVALVVPLICDYRQRVSTEILRGARETLAITCVFSGVRRTPSVS